MATGFDRVILLQRGTVETVGLYAPALAVLAAMAIVPGAVSTWVFPRMSYALGQGRTPGRCAAWRLRPERSPWPRACPWPSWAGRWPPR